MTSQSCETLLKTQVLWNLLSVQTAESVGILDLGGFRQTTEPYYLQQLCVSMSVLSPERLLSLPYLQILSHRVQYVSTVAQNVHITHCLYDQSATCH